MAKSKSAESPLPASDQITLAETAWNILKEEHPGWSVDELLLHPKQEIELCKTVRRQLSKDSADDVILRALLNGRKRGLIRPMVRRRWRKS